MLLQDHFEAFVRCELLQRMVINGIVIDCQQSASLWLAELTCQVASTQSFLMLISYCERVDEVYMIAQKHSTITDYGC